MSRNNHEIKKEKEEVIFNAALKVIKSKGFHKARMSDIASHAKISYGLIYHYFKNKEDLLDAIINRWWTGLFTLTDDFQDEEIPVQNKLRRLIHYFLNTYQNNPELMNIFVNEISRSTTNLTGDRLEHFKKFISFTESAITKGQKAGTLRTDFKARYLTHIFLGSLETFISTMVLADQKIKGDAQKKEIADSILEVFLNGAKSK